MDKKTHSPLFHIAKRSALPWYVTWGIRGTALLLALVACGVVTSLVTGENPFQIYAAIFKGSFGTPRKFWVLLQNLPDQGGDLWFWTAISAASSAKPELLRLVGVKAPWLGQSWEGVLRRLISKSPVAPRLSPPSGLFFTCWVLNHILL